MSNGAHFVGMVVCGLMLWGLDAYAARSSGKKDITAPTITSFAVPATSSSLTVSGIVLVASDNKGVTGYILKEGATSPLRTAQWSAIAPRQYIFSSFGSKTLFAWVRDAAGNISAARSAAVTISPTTPSPTPTVTPTPTPSPTPTQTPTPTPTSQSGSILFADNFNASPDWQSQQTVHKSVGGTDRAWPVTYALACTTTCPPQGWTAYRAAASYFTDHPGLDTFVLSAQGHRTSGPGATGLTGKGITRNAESSGDYGSWEGGSLDLSLGAQGQREVIVRYWLKYDPEWLWTNPENTQHALQKLIRISRFSGNITDYQNRNPQMFFAPTENGPSWMPDWYYNKSYGTNSFFSSEFFNPQPSGSIGYGPTQNFDSLRWPSDGQWHLYEFRVKMNSAPGVADGQWEIWIDGATTTDKHASKANVLWVDATGSVNPGWNYLMFLDNITVAPAPVSAKMEMQIYLDDVVVYTPMSASDPACGGRCTSDGRLPLDYVVPKLSNL